MARLRRPWRLSCRFDRRQHPLQVSEGPPISQNSSRGAATPRGHSFRNTWFKRLRYFDPAMYGTSNLGSKLYPTAKPRYFAVESSAIQRRLKKSAGEKVLSTVERTDAVIRVALWDFGKEIFRPVHFQSRATAFRTSIPFISEIQHACSFRRIQK